MLNSYKARIVDGHIDWLGRVPAGLSRGRGVEVVVSLVDKAITSNIKQRKGKKMAEILEKLSALNVTADIPNPLEWQRAQREERPLNGRS